MRRYEILKLLEKHGPLSTREIATRINIIRMNAIEYLRTAERKGHVKSKLIWIMNPTGGRVKARMWYITNKGKKWIASLES